MTDRWRGRGQLVALASGLVLCGCYTFSDGTEEFEAAERGDVAGIHALGELGDPRVPSSKRAVRSIREAYPLLIAQLDAEDPFRRLTAVEALRRLGERRPDQHRLYGLGALDPLLSDPDPDLRWRVAWALGRIGFPRPALRAATADADPRVAERAVWAVGETRDEEAVPVLLAALDRPGPVGEQAVWALQRSTGLTLATADAWRTWAKERGVVPADPGPR